MPIIPTVFRPIRSNDFQRRAFKAYKNYRITNVGFVTSSGYVHHNAIYHKLPINIGHAADVYPINSLDDTNQHVIWHSLNHRYYKHPADPVRTSELPKASKNLYESASCLIAPYFEVGERIKPGSVTGTFTHGHSYNLYDDGHGNLLDTAINSSSFASSSRNIFYTSFNKEFDPNIQGKSNITIVPGITTSGLSLESGLAARFNFIDSRIRIPHEEKFNKFNRTDDWTISFWTKITPSATSNHFPLISKGGVTRKTVFDQKNSIYQVKDKITSMIGITGSYNNLRTPFVVGFESNNNSGSWHFQSSNGANSLHIQTNFIDYKKSDVDWKHIAIRNSGSLCQIFVDGVASNASGSIPPGSVANTSDIIIGSFVNGSMISPGSDLAEIRMYDYAVNTTGLASLANRNYLSGQLYQTSVAGNVFYRSGEIVISSPMPKYNTGSGAFGNIFDVSYKGSHVVYENEVLIRVPKDQFNASMNPTSTYTPATDKILSIQEQSNSLPGDTRKTIFTSGIANPYITTIGLYNDKAQLVAVSKLAQPIQKRDDIDMNFIIRWDY